MTRILVLGGGLIGRRHVERVQAHPATVCAGLVDPDPAACADLEVPRLAGPEDADCDAVILATPSHLHKEQALAAASRGWPVLIEKPVATTLADADALIAGCTVPALVGHHRRHHPRVQALKALLDSGRIGRPVTATLIWAMRKPDSYFDGNWRSAGGSPVMINLVHDLDLLRFWFGEISALAALPGARLRGTPRLESGAVALTHASGVAATISFADTAPSPWGFEAGTGENPGIGRTGQDMLWIAGTEGGVGFPSLTLWHGTDWSEPARAEATPDVPETAPLDRQLDHFLDVIAGRAVPLCTLQDGRAALAAALLIEEQMQTSGCTQRCPT